MALDKKRISLEEAIPKIRTYCNYRERCHWEVREKLYSMGLWKREVEQALIQMMDENLLNEERYARSFARGYFRTKQWGKIKIRIALKQRGINDKLIDYAFTEIDPDEYAKTIARLIDKKDAQLRGLSLAERRQKIVDHMLRKGYHHGEISDALEVRLKRSKS